jgi:hypothetical protein
MELEKDAVPDDRALWQHVIGTRCVYPERVFARLVGFRLYSVHFVLDYVQLHFDGPAEDSPVLNCDVLPVVETSAGLIRPLTDCLRSSARCAEVAKLAR